MNDAGRRSYLEQAFIAMDGARERLADVKPSAELREPLNDVYQLITVACATLEAMAVAEHRSLMRCGADGL